MFGEENDWKINNKARAFPKVTKIGRQDEIKAFDSTGA
jgi:hypothetical protein